MFCGQMSPRFSCFWEKLTSARASGLLSEKGANERMGGMGVHQSPWIICVKVPLMQRWWMLGFFFLLLGGLWLFQQDDARPHSAWLKQLHQWCVSAVHTCLLLKVCEASWGGESDSNNWGLLSKNGHRFFWKTATIIVLSSQPIKPSYKKEDDVTQWQ